MLAMTSVIVVNVFLFAF